MLMRKPLIAANWKENKTNEEAATFLKNLKKGNFRRREVLVCPSFVSIITAYDCTRDSDIKIGAQDISNYDTGAYTGEVSAQMIIPFCEYVHGFTGCLTSFFFTVRSEFLSFTICKHSTNSATP